MLSAGQLRRFRTAVLEDPRCERVTDLLVQRGAEVLLEHSTTGGAARDLFSVTKTVLAITAGIAVERGHLDLDAAVRSSPGMAGFDGLGDQTVRHLLTMTRGAQVGGALDLDQVAVREQNWAGAFARSPQVTAPGERFAYDNGSSQLLAETLHRAVPGGLLGFAAGHLFRPLGIADVRWDADASGTPSGAAHLYLTAREAARLGMLLLANGTFDGRRVLPAGWVAAMRQQSSNGGPPEERPYGMGLWLDPDGSFFGAGWAGQLLYCRPSDQLLLVSLADAGFDYGPPATDRMPADWLAPLLLARGTVLTG